jgi:hypothetical protein
MKATMTAALLLIASLSHADCPEIPAAQRVRIIPCNQGYAVQEWKQDPWADAKIYGWFDTVACGATLPYARDEKAFLIAVKDRADTERCAPPNLPLEPVRVAE